MLFSITISPQAPGGIGITVQVEAPDLIRALEVAKPLVLKNAQDSAATLLGSLPATPAAQPPAAAAEAAAAVAAAEAGGKPTP